LDADEHLRNFGGSTNRPVTASLPPQSSSHPNAFPFKGSVKSPGTLRSGLFSHSTLVD
jgi:hypothetical protein